MQRCFETLLQASSSRRWGTSPEDAFIPWLPRVDDAREGYMQPAPSHIVGPLGGSLIMSCGSSLSCWHQGLTTTTAQGPFSHPTGLEREFA